ncbi:MAG: hypothetical protein LBB88_08290 [Planctomycetaceae bacterium]|nr:hypothetical protein [Planctomycetaceae bacterium]
MPCVSIVRSMLIDRDAKHCVSTLGLVIQIRILKTVNGYRISLVVLFLSSNLRKIFEAFIGFFTSNFFSI